LRRFFWTAPLALAPLGRRLTRPRFLLYLSPYLISVMVGGWIGMGFYGPYVDGAVPVRCARGRADDEQRVAERLRERGIQSAVADYWLAYRLTFLFDENPMVIPEARGMDRNDRLDSYAATLRRAPHEEEQVSGFSLVYVDRSRAPTSWLR
jgi:hypothetical protein